MSEIRIAPSVFAADLGLLREQLAELEQAGADLLHVDVMDGHFVERMAFGADHVRALRKLTRLPLDVHMMVERPENHLDSILDDVDMILLMTVNPGEGGQHFLPAVLDKIKCTRGMIGERPIDLEVDGSIDDKVIWSCYEAGANVFVSGGYLFKGSITENIAKLRKACE